MRVIIAGSRSIHLMPLLEKAITQSGFAITQVVCGCADGVDTLGEQWAFDHKCAIAYFPADWKRYAKSAGFIRNGEMAKNADALIAITDGSPGTHNMIQQARSKGLQLFLCILEGKKTAEKLLRYADTSNIRHMVEKGAA